MNYPVFEHVITGLRSLIDNENEPLSKIADLLKYDPGIYFSLLQKNSASEKTRDITSINQIANLIGAGGIESHILEQDLFLSNEHLLLWIYSTLSAETALALNHYAEVAQDDEAFLAGMITPIAILLMLEAEPRYKKIVDLIIRIPTADKVFVEEKLFKTNHIEKLASALTSPKVFKDAISLMSNIFAKDGTRLDSKQQPGKFSVAYKSLQLLQLLEASEAAAQMLIFPDLIDAREKFTEMSKRHFRIAEHEMEELLADVLDKFEYICSQFNVSEISSQFIAKASEYHSSFRTFSTNSEPLKKSMAEAIAAHNSGRNILIHGENGTGKRLFAISLYRHADNPLHSSPYVSMHCGHLDADSMDIELFGARGGFMKLEKHKGLFELAANGTILLKQIDRMPVEMQERLAEIISKGEFFRIGDTEPIKFRTKFIITSRKNISEEARANNFSKKLLAVLNPFEFYLLPLRERRQDLEFIGQGIIGKYDLNLGDSEAIRMGLNEYYETYEFPNNLPDLKRLLFYISARQRLNS
ncbi:MAG: sigma 54-interacting transcriptional regulator [Nitrospiraceae bacterium]|nr:sigma 54-interacting transcriptional regulator [Nitrospiraceae bacterium]